MMKKLGFTLTDLLISLSVIGVISALTMPALVTAHQKNLQGAALSSAISDFETAMRTMITAEDVAELTETRAWRELPNKTISSTTADDAVKQFVGNISDYIEIASYDRSIANFYAGNTIRDISRSNVGTGNFAMAGKVVLSTNKNIAYMINTGSAARRTTSVQEALENGINLREIAAFVLIDTNGPQKPNTFGRDIFYFELGNDGVLYPFGGRDVSLIYSKNFNSTWDRDDSFYACTDAVKNNMGIGCTARVIENGYKIDY